VALTFTQADLDALKEAFVTGALEVQIGDRRVRYRSQSELLAALRMVEEAVSGITETVDENPNVVQAGFARTRVTEE
jgi:hypothetical protein